MKIDFVTITGADDSVDIKSMSDVNNEFLSKTEWGILFSQSRIGTPRYPSIGWLDKLQHFQFHGNSSALALSAHLCGNYSVELLNGNIDSWFWDISQYSEIFNRFQLNFNSQKTLIPDKFKFVQTINRLALKYSCDFILQYNDSNKKLCVDAYYSDLIQENIHFLHDSSGGRGKSPKLWTAPEFKNLTGYAGGLNPDNLEEELKKIADVVGDRWIWIDVESGVRTDDELDFKKVRKFLEVASKYF